MKILIDPKVYILTEQRTIKECPDLSCGFSDKLFHHRYTFVSFILQTSTVLFVQFSPHKSDITIFKEITNDAYNKMHIHIHIHKTRLYNIAGLVTVLLSMTLLKSKREKKTPPN